MSRTKKRYFCLCLRFCFDGVHDCCGVHRIEEANLKGRKTKPPDKADCVVVLNINCDVLFGWLGASGITHVQRHSSHPHGRHTGSSDVDTLTRGPPRQLAVLVLCLFTLV